VVSAFLTAVGVYAIYFLISALVFHFVKVSKHVMRVMGGLFILCLPLILLLFPAVKSIGLDAALPEGLQFALLTTVGFVILWSVYFQSFALLHCSISFRLLIHFREAKNQTMTVRETQEVYPFKQVIIRKIDMMLKDGLVTEAGAAGSRVFVTTSAGKLMGSIFHHVKNFTHWGAGG
jgi:hypothetical protein